MSKTIPVMITQEQCKRFIFWCISLSNRPMSHWMIAKETHLDSHFHIVGLLCSCFPNKTFYQPSQTDPVTLFPVLSWVPIGCWGHLVVRHLDQYFSQVHQVLHNLKQIRHSFMIDFNSLWPGDTTWQHRAGSTLAQDIVCTYVDQVKQCYGITLP